ncbi:Uncharacterised protein [Mycolicibacterium flavescens]|nr:Uncharacterised protein [Mycolicibacterium flavescens]
MSQADIHTTENDAIDWLALAEQVFPADRL